jgi:polysaccharide export outer membrane protein
LGWYREGSITRHIRANRKGTAGYPQVQSDVMNSRQFEMGTMRYFPALVMLWSVAVAAPASGEVSGSAEAPASYVLGPEDQISVRALEADEISDKPVQIDGAGYISLPLVGRVRAQGLTTHQLEQSLTEALKTHLEHPMVSVSITDFRSQPVSVAGAVNNPSVQQLRGKKTLIEVISMSGGLRPDAGYSVKLTRQGIWGRIPLPNATEDPTGNFSVAEVSVQSLMDARNPAENILIRPNDVILVPRAEVVYVIGEVRKAGGFPLRERETMTVLQALALAEGLDRFPALHRAMILRGGVGQTGRAEISVDLGRILAGKADDLPLRPDDILFIPSNGVKKASIRAVEAAIQMGTGVVIWGRR